MLCDAGNQHFPTSKLAAQMEVQLRYTAHRYSSSPATSTQPWHRDPAFACRAERGRQLPHGAPDLCLSTPWAALHRDRSLGTRDCDSGSWPCSGKPLCCHFSAARFKELWDTNQCRRGLDSTRCFTFRTKVVAKFLAQKWEVSYPTFNLPLLAVSNGHRIERLNSVILEPSLFTEAAVMCKVHL